MSDLKHNNSTKPIDNLSPKNIEFITFGCRLNHFESKAMEKISHEVLNADDNKEQQQGKIYFINSCAVTNETVRQLSQKIRSLKKNDNSSRIIVSGCAVEQDLKSLLLLDEVDAYLGNIEKLEYKNQKKALLNTREKDGLHKIKGDYDDSNDSRYIAFGEIRNQNRVIEKTNSYSDDKVKANIKIQNGCDHDCTFCVIPHTRGKSRSVKADEIIEKISEFVDKGFLEVILTGVDIADYGKDFEQHYSLGNLVNDILDKIPDLQRLRLSSIDVDEIDEELVSVFKNHQRLMPHLHLSLQSGDNLILKRMKRRHNRQEAIKFCKKIKQIRPDIVFGADFIVGFPTETEEMFNNSIKLIDECEISFLHVFPYSPRPGTKAFLMPQVARNIIKERAKIMRDYGERRRQLYYKNELGQVRSLLVERGNIGKTEHFTPAILVEDKNKDAKYSENFKLASKQKIIEVKIVGSNKYGLKAAEII